MFLPNNYEFKSIPFKESSGEYNSRHGEIF